MNQCSVQFDDFSCSDTPGLTLLTERFRAVRESSNCVGLWPSRTCVIRKRRPINEIISLL